MDRIHCTIALAAAVFLAAASLTGCGGGVECGPNTKPEDGACVPDADVACGEGTVAKGHRCIAGEASCGENTQFSSERGTCVPERSACSGPGVSFENGRCVAVSECGSGTRENDDGFCVPEFTCPDNGAIRPDPASGKCVIAAGGCTGGAVRSAQGTCVIDETSCGDGLAVEDGECVPSDDLCGKGLALSEEGVCEPTSEVCGEAAVFDEEMGLCLPEGTCEMGDVVLNGVCVSPAEKLAANADVDESENNDPRLGGTPTTFSAPDSTGKTTVFSGTIEEPSDRDGNGTLDQDRDFFEFDAEAGDWFQLSVQSTGLPNPNVVVTGPEGYRRAVNNGPNLAAARHLAIPRPGTYRIRILPDSRASDDELGPVGGDDWGYVGSLEAVSSPSPRAVDLTDSTASGDATGLTTNLYEVEGFSGADALTLTPTTLGDDLQATISVWRDADNFIGSFRTDEGQSRTLPVPDTDSGTFLMLVDWRRVDGTDVGYDIEGAAVSDVESLGNPGADGEATSTARDVSSVYYYTFTVPAGQVAELTHTNADDDEATLRLLDASGRQIVEKTLDPRASTGPSDEKAAYRYAAETTTYLLAVEPRFSFSSLSDASIRLRTSTPADLGTAGPGDTVQTTVTEAVDQGYAGWATLELSSTSGIAGSISSHTPSDSDVEFSWESPNHRRLDFATADSSKTAEFDLPRARRGTLLLKAEPRLGGNLDEYTTDLEIESPTPREEEPNNLQVTATSTQLDSPIIGTVERGNPDYFELQLAQGLGSNEVLLVELDGSAGETYACRLENDAGDVVTASDSTSDACVLTAAGLASGAYYLRVDTESESSIDYRLEARKESGIIASGPNDEMGDAETFDYSSFKSGVRLFGKIDESDSTDWYEFTLPSSLGPDTYVAFDLDMLAPVQSSANYARLVVELHSAGGNVLAKGIRTDYGEVEGLAVRGLQSGTYFVEVSTPNPDGIRTESGDYALGFDQTYTPDQSVAWTDGATIPDDDSAGITRQVNVSNCQTIDDVHLDLSVTHPDRADIAVELESPEAGPVTVKPAPNADILFGEPLDVADIANVFTLGAPSYKNFDAFDGTTGNGTWNLTVSDDSSLAGEGTLDSWRVNLTCQ